jgi:hypothetical protein
VPNPSRTCVAKLGVEFDDDEGIVRRLEHAAGAASARQRGQLRLAHGAQQHGRGHRLGTAGEVEQWAARKQLVCQRAQHGRLGGKGGGGAVGCRRLPGVDVLGNLCWWVAGERTMQWQVCQMGRPGSKTEQPPFTTDPHLWGANAAAALDALHLAQQLCDHLGLGLGLLADRRLRGWWRQRVGVGGWSPPSETPPIARARDLLLTN